MRKLAIIGGISLASFAAGNMIMHKQKINLLVEVLYLLLVLLIDSKIKIMCENCPGGFCPWC
jgi:hypothetical protein